MLIENEIQKTKEEIINLKRKSSEKNLSRRERASHLISVGALCEIAGIDKVDKEILLGYFLWFNDVPVEKLEKLRKRGTEEFKRREALKKSKK